MANKKPWQKKPLYEGEDDFGLTNHAVMRLRQRGIAEGSLRNNPHVRAIFDETGTTLISAYYKAEVPKLIRKTVQKLPVEKAQEPFIQSAIRIVQVRFPLVGMRPEGKGTIVVSVQGAPEDVNQALSFLRNQLWMTAGFDLKTGALPEAHVDPEHVKKSDPTITPKSQAVSAPSPEMPTEPKPAKPLGGKKAKEPKAKAANPGMPTDAKPAKSLSRKKQKEERTKVKALSQSKPSTTPPNGVQLD